MSGPRSQLPPQRIPALLPGLMSDKDLGPATPSMDYEAMRPYWDMVAVLVEGQDAVRAAGAKYLPRHPEELEGDYQYRLANAILTNIYGDVIEGLAAKPFDEEVKIVEGSASTFFIGEQVQQVANTSKKSSKRTGGFIENVDGKGSHIHVFLNEWFFHGINNAIDWVFVDYPKVSKSMTKAQEAALGLTPYWYRIPALHVLECDEQMCKGKLTPVTVRIIEFAKVKKDYKESIATRVRIIERAPIYGTGDLATKIIDYGVPVWRLEEWQRESENSAGKWVKIDEGEYSIGEIPIVPLVIGRRVGTSWVLTPPMRSAANLQIELYQAETGLKNTKNLMYYPMLTANGVNLKDDKGNQVKVVIGPHTILNTPPSVDGNSAHGEWNLLEPSAESGTFCSGEIKSIKADLRELGRQPLTAQSSGITVIAAAFASQKSNSALGAWTIMLKDAAENALRLTAMWVKDTSEPEVQVRIPDPIDMDGQSSQNILTMRDKGDLSQDTLWSEMRRRGILASEFDSEQERDKLKNEVPSDTGNAEDGAPIDPENNDPANKGPNQ